jgi:phospholipid/cholesterol/gamma-HCH transport system substrate-binding protein
VKSALIGAVWRLTIFVVVCLTGIAALFAIFAQLRFFDEQRYTAVFSNVSGLASGNFVRIAGVEIGKVKAIRLQHDATVTVEFTTEPSVVMTEGTRAVIRYDNLIGGRYLALEEGPGDARVVPPGGTIPLARTAPALDLDALTGGFRPLFRALNPDQVNSLTQQLISAFQGEGATMGSLLTQLSAVTSTLADRDALIGEVVTNLDTVLTSLGERSGQLDKTVTALSELVGELADRREDISTGIAYTDAAAASTADLLAEARPAVAEDVAQTNRVAGVVMSDKDYFAQVLDTLPDKYRLLGRQGLYGDYFSFYLCDAVLKMNGKGGQPVYIKVAGQSTGRCAPK